MQWLAEPTLKVIGSYFGSKNILAACQQKVINWLRVRTASILCSAAAASGFALKLAFAIEHWASSSPQLVMVLNGCVFVFYNTEKKFLSVFTYCIDKVRKTKKNFKLK